MDKRKIEYFFCIVNAIIALTFAMTISPTTGMPNGILAIYFGIIAGW